MSKSFLTSLFFFFLSTFFIFAQDNRAQLPKIMQNAYFDVNIGSINYAFDATQFNQNLGYKFTSSSIPHVGVRLVLFGYQFNKYLSAQITYMRPVHWVKYNFEDTNSFYSKTVWMNVGGLTIKPQLPIGKFTLFGEGGLAIITRHGFKAFNSDSWLVKGSNYSSYLLGGGIKYKTSQNWGWVFSGVYSPANKKENQPKTTFMSGGFSYQLTKIKDDKVERSTNSGIIHPKNRIQFGVSTNGLGYGVNKLFSQTLPLFWGGMSRVKTGFTLNYQRNVYHSAKTFSFDWGISASHWQSDIKKDDFFTLSIFPVVKFTVLHTKPADYYFYYSVAGPTYISKIDIEGLDTGKHFTFQDNMGWGAYFGKKREYSAEFKIGHYSNGNLFTENPGVQIPLSLNLGYNFL